MIGTFRPMKNFDTCPMLDHSIILQILYYKSSEGQVYSMKRKRECTEDKSLIFFPPGDVKYLDRLNDLDSLQYMQRLTLLYSIIWKTN